MLDNINLSNGTQNSLISRCWHANLKYLQFIRNVVMTVTVTKWTSSRENLSSGRQSETQLSYRH